MGIGSSGECGQGFSKRQQLAVNKQTTKKNISRLIENYLTTHGTI